MRMTLGQLQDAKRAQQGLSTRASKQAMYNTRAWKTASRHYKQANPLCVECQRVGRTSPAWATDHILPHGGNERLFWDERNWQALCKKCHNKKSQGEGSY